MEASPGSASAWLAATMWVFPPKHFASRTSIAGLEPLAWQILIAETVAEIQGKIAAAC
jgi:hypothetical protein